MTDRKKAPKRAKRGSSAARRRDALPTSEKAKATSPGTKTISRAPPRAKRQPKRTTRREVKDDDAASRPTLRIQRELDVHREELATQNEELRRANAELLNTKERYAQLYDGAPVAYFTLDEAGIILEANIAGAELLESSRNFLFGRRFDDVVVPSSRESFRKFRQRVLEHGARPVQDTVLVVSGRRLPVRVEAARLATMIGRPVTSIPQFDGGPPLDPPIDPGMQLLLCVTDETERRSLDEERRALEARVAEAQRVESLGLLAGGIAHDFNNILAAVLANVDLVLLEEEGLPDGTVRSVQEIRDSVNRAAHLSKQMLAYTGRGYLETTPRDVSQIITSMAALLQSAVPKSVTLKLDLAEDLPLVSCDSVQIQQIVLDLVVNAAEAITSSRTLGSAPSSTSSHGTVVVRTKTSTADPIPALESSLSDSTTASRRGARDAREWERSRPYVLIEVIDNGRGMDEATRQRAFDPFFSTKLTGRGLGLAVVYGNTRAHGGKVEVESRPHGGTTFRVSLPAATSTSMSTSEQTDPPDLDGEGRHAKNEQRSAPAAPASAAVAVLDKYRGSGLVLVVDDEPSVRDVVGRVLSHVGFDVCYADDGYAAVERVSAASSDRNLTAVLLDLTMPGMSGEQTLGQIKRLAPRLPVVLMSGFSDAPLNDELMSLANGFIPKPFTLSEVVRAMQQAISTNESALVHH